MPEWRIIFALLFLALLCRASAAQSLLLLGFETEDDIASIDIGPAPGALSDQHVTQGRYSLRVPAGDYVSFLRLPADWSGFDTLEVDVYADTAAPLSLLLLIGDSAWQDKPTYWNRHNATLSLRPGASTVSIPLGGLYRGEAGSRYNDLRTSIDVSSIVRLGLSFDPVAGEGFVYLDNMRLTRSSRPDSVLAFDFGPVDQAVAPGFTPVSPDSAYSDERGWGWLSGPGPDSAWDVTFPTRLLQDSVEMGDSVFRMRLPQNRYCALVFFEPLGYWGGEQAQFARRTVHLGDSTGVTSHQEWGPLDHVYHFQNTEPRPGDDLWQIYMEYLFRPAEITFEPVGPEGICDLRVEADGPLARRLAALIVFPAADDEARRWAWDAYAAQQEEFRSRAVELPLPETENPAPITEADRARGYLLFRPGIEQTVYFSALPTSDQLDAQLDGVAARGERRSLTIALHPLRDLGATALKVSDLDSDSGAIPAERVTLSLVRHLPSRSYESLMYRIAPRYLVRADAVDLPAGLTRQLWLTVRVPENSPPGLYQGSLTLSPEHADAIEVPIRLFVLPFALEEAEFASGFFGIQPDVPVEGEAHDALQREVLEAFAERGFTSFTGGPRIRFEGLDESGDPILNFADADAFMAAAKQAGFHREFNNYGGFVVSGLSSGYVKGRTGQALEERYQLPYEEIARRVWAAVEDHAGRQEWLPFTYTMCDETRVLEVANEQLELMRLFNRASSWLRTTGAYSVSFKPTEDPVALAHQEFFRVLDSATLNSHDETVMAEARRLGKEVYIYNQGRGRYQFGLYQWSESAKGVRGRYEWISFIRHGYEYFDLDGREPDPSMLFFSSGGLRPSLALEQCAEGMNDFRYLQTLASAAAQAARSDRAEVRQAAAEAQAFLEGLAGRIALNERRQPDWLDLDAVRAEAARRRLDLLRLSAP